MLWRKWKLKSHRRPDERRREPRFADGVEIDLVPNPTDGVKSAKRSYRVRAKNVSPGGLKVECVVPIPVGTVLTVRIQSPKTKRDIRATAEVKWLAPVEGGEVYELGLEFVQTNVHNILSLLEHIYKG